MLDIIISKSYCNCLASAARALLHIKGTVRECITRRSVDMCRRCHKWAAVVLLMLPGMVMEEVKVLL